MRLLPVLFGALLAAACGSVPAATSPAATASPTPVEAPASPSAQPSAVPLSDPVQLEIPSIGGNARVTGLALDSHGDLGVPGDASSTAWYTGSARPGEPGNAVDSGHGGVAYVGSTASQGSYDPVSGVWTVGTLANGATATLQITVLVNTTNPVINSANVLSSDNLDPDLKQQRIQCDRHRHGSSRLRKRWRLPDLAACPPGAAAGSAHPPGVEAARLAPVIEPASRTIRSRCARRS